MDVWEVPYSSCPGLDKGFLMDVGPEQAKWQEGEWRIGGKGRVLTSSNPVAPIHWGQAGDILIG